MCCRALPNIPIDNAPNNQIRISILILFGDLEIVFCDRAVVFVQEKRVSLLLLHITVFYDLQELKTNQNTHSQM